MTSQQPLQTILEAADAYVAAYNKYGSSAYNVKTDAARKALEANISALIAERDALAAEVASATAQVQTLLERMPK